MNSVQEKLSIFSDIIQCTPGIYYWSFNADLELTETNCPPDQRDGHQLFLMHQARGSFTDTPFLHLPYIIDTFLNLLWIVDFEWQEDKVAAYHLIGPFFTARNSYLQLKEKLDKRNFSIATKLILLKKIDFIPILPTNLVYQYAVMLHYCISGEKITSQSIQYPYHDKKQESDPVELHLESEHLNLWIAEENLMRAIREGSLNYRPLLDTYLMLLQLIPESDPDLRFVKNHILSLITLSARAAISGGLSSDKAYTLSDHYTQKCEDSHSVTEAVCVGNTMLRDYISHLNHAQRDYSLSPAVRQVCETVLEHTEEKISIAQLALQAGYSEYYLTRKFRQEMGIGLIDYINQQKIERAKLLLTTTSLKIQEISARLSFRSRSHFSDTFFKYAETSPKEYRKAHQKL